MIGESRLQRLLPHELTAEQRRMYDAVVDGPRHGTRGLVDGKGRLGGPLNTLLHAPLVGVAQQRLGAALRYEISLPRRVVELVVLTVAHDAESDFELAAHEPMACDAGFSDQQLAALRKRRDPQLQDRVERIAWQTTVRMLEAGDLDDDAYEQAVRVLGERGLVELVTLIGYYRLLALQLRVFRISAGAYTGARCASSVPVGSRN